MAMHATGKRMYGIVEIFESLQGEGRNTGRPCLFVRFAGCNLACPWCDTDFTPRLTLTLDALLDEVSSFRTKNIILTGGEPTIQPGIPELVAELKKRGYWIAVETNGTMDVTAAPWLEFVDYIACSPKMLYPSSLRLEAANEVRVVADPSVPLEKALDFCKSLPMRINAQDYYISPCDLEAEGGGKGIDFATAKALLAALGDGWSLSVQLHKILGFR